MGEWLAEEARARTPTKCLQVVKTSQLELLEAKKEARGTHLTRPTTPCSWKPRTERCAAVPVKYGSGENVSQLRPPYGLRPMGPMQIESGTCAPSVWYSLAMATARA